jgi:predicted metal-dependent peptidase
MISNSVSLLKDDFKILQTIGSYLTSDAQEISKKFYVIAVETSSMFHYNKVNEIIGSIVETYSNINKEIDGKIIYFDYKILKVEEAKEFINTKTSNVVIDAGGGTDYVPVFNWIDSNKDKECICLFYITDGFGNYPKENPSYPVVWINDYESQYPFGELLVL